MKITKLLFFCLLCSFSGGRLCAASALEQLQAAAPAGLLSAPEPAPASAGSGRRTNPAKPGSFAAAADKAYRFYANYVTIHTLPSPSPMDWSNISTLAASYARNEMLKKTMGQTHAIGHVTFEIGCTLPDGSRERFMSGQVPEGMMADMAQVKAGAGFSVLFGHVPGKLQTRAAIEAELDILSSIDNEAALLTLRVSRESCLEALRYIKAYRDEGVYTRYGLGVRPLHKEGGGCANTGVSVVEVAGPANFSSLSAPWSRTIYVPDQLLGTPQNPMGIGDVARFLNYDWSKNTSVASRKLFFYDPDLIYNWVQAAYANGAAESRPAERYTVNKTRGVTLDYTWDSRPAAWWRTEAE